MSIHEELEKIQIEKLFMNNLEMLLLDYRLLPRTYMKEFRDEVLSNIEFITCELIEDVKNESRERTIKTYVEDKLIKGIDIKNEQGKIIEGIKK